MHKLLLPSFLFFLLYPAGMEAQTAAEAFPDLVPIALAASGPVYDFEVDNIYYDSIDGTTQAKVTAGSNSFNSYSGAVVIPSTVTNPANGVTYTVTQLGMYAFAYSAGMTSLILPESVTSIGTSCFYECTGMASLTIPSSVTVLSTGACLACSGLQTIVLAPSSLSSAGTALFGYCSSLQNFYCNIASPTGISENSNFAGVTVSNVSLYVPLNAVSDYSSNSSWAGFNSISGYYNLTVSSLATNGTDYYSTLYLPNNAVTLPAGVQAGYISSASGGMLTPVAISSVLPAGTAALLTVAAPGEYTLLSTTTAAVPPSTNLLQGVATSTTLSNANTYYYVLSRAVNASGSPLVNTIGFYWYAANGNSVTCPANRAYLSLPVAASAPIRSYTLGAWSTTGDATLLPFPSLTLDSEEEAVIYNLHGCRLSCISHSGIYIVNGKKIVVNH